MDAINKDEMECACSSKLNVVEGLTFECCDYENPVHLNTLALLVNAYMSDPMGGASPLNKLQQLRLVEGLANHPSALVLFALLDNEVAGYTVCFINFSTFRVKSYLNIHDFFVLNEFRSKSVASGMMTKLVDIAKERGYCKLNLEVREDNVVAQKLYKNCGFTECEPAMYFWTRQI